MKAILSICVSMMLLSTSGYAQSCKYKTDKTDPITNKKTLRTEHNVNFYYTISFYREDEDLRVESYVNMPGRQLLELAPGSKLDLKLADGKVIILESVAVAAPVAFVAADQVYSSYATSYKVSKEQAAQIAASGIAYSKSHLYGETHYEHTYKTKEIEKVQKAAACVWAQ